MYPTLLAAVLFGGCKPVECEENTGVKEFVPADELTKYYGESVINEYFPDALPVDAFDAEIDSLGDNECLAAFTLSATWCGPCQVFKPQFAELAQKFPKVQFLRIEEFEGAKALDLYSKSIWFEDDGLQQHPDYAGKQTSLTFPTTGVAKMRELKNSPQWFFFNEDPTVLEDAIKFYMDGTKGYKKKK